MRITNEQIAQICHEANRTYCHTIGDDSQPEWEFAPDWQRQSAINGVNFHMFEHSQGRKPLASASHESWMKEKAEQGWKYGPVKNPETKEHPCFLPYDQLPLEQRMKDYIFGSIVESFWLASCLEAITEDADQKV
jgi:hypothetical protein